MRIAHVAAMAEDGRFVVTVVVAEVAGHSPVPNEPPLDAWDAAQARADALNAACGVSPSEAGNVLASAMRASRAADIPWRRRG